MPPVAPKPPNGAPKAKPPGGGGKLKIAGVRWEYVAGGLVLAIAVGLYLRHRLGSSTSGGVASPSSDSGTGTAGGGSGGFDPGAATLDDVTALQDQINGLTGILSNTFAAPAGAEIVTDQGSLDAGTSVISPVGAISTATAPTAPFGSASVTTLGVVSAGQKIDAVGDTAPANIGQYPYLNPTAPNEVFTVVHSGSTTSYEPKSTGEGFIASAQIPAATGSALHPSVPVAAPKPKPTPTPAKNAAQVRKNSI